MTILETLNILPFWVVLSMAFFYGTCFGSFLNVVIYRLPKMEENQYKEYIDEYCGELGVDKPFIKYTQLEKKPIFNLSKPSSHCPNCNHKIRWYENIPLFSYVFLKGKCSSCKVGISCRYPLIELVAGVLSVLLVYKTGINVSYMPYFIALMLIIPLCMIDVDQLILPDSLVFPLMWLGVFSALMHFTPLTLEQSVMGLFVGYMTMSFTYWMGRLLFKKEGLGYGDFKLMAALGAWLGWKLIILTFFLSSIVGTIFGLSYLALKSKDSDKPFPYGPSIIIAAIFSFVWGERLLSWYL